VTCWELRAARQAVQRRELAAARERRFQRLSQRDPQTDPEIADRAFFRERASAIAQIDHVLLTDLEREQAAQLAEHEEHVASLVDDGFPRVEPIKRNWWEPHPLSLRQPHEPSRRTSFASPDLRRRSSAGTARSVTARPSFWWIASSACWTSTCAGRSSMSGGVGTLLTATGRSRSTLRSTPERSCRMTAITPRISRRCDGSTSSPRGSDTELTSRRLVRIDGPIASGPRRRDDTEHANGWRSTTTRSSPARSRRRRLPNASRYSVLAGRNG
jgi:hypothetical protein